MNLFVFGTLMYADVLKALLNTVPYMTDATLYGYRRGKIMVPGREAKGPAIARSIDGVVSGKLLLDLNEAQMRIMDLFETAASGYERLLGRIETQSGDHQEAYFYASTEEIEKFVSDQDWSEEEFENNFLDLYVNERIPSLLKEWKSRGLIETVDSCSEVENETSK